MRLTSCTATVITIAVAEYLNPLSLILLRWNSPSYDVLARNVGLVAADPTLDSSVVFNNLGVIFGVRVKTPFPHPRL